jgi:ribosomal protein S18 acetylase RimI-like enzyme
MGGEASLVRPRFARGVRCFAAIVDGAIAGYGWLSTQPEWIGELQLDISPGPGEAYLWNCATVPEHRRRGIFKALLTGISNHAQAAGLRRLWIGSVAIPAEKVVGPSGFRRALRFSTWTLGSAHVLISRPAAEADAKLVREARIALGSQEAPMRLGLSVRGRIARIH